MAFNLDDEGDLRLVDDETHSVLAVLSDGAVDPFGLVVVDWDGEGDALALLDGVDHTGPDALSLDWHAWAVVSAQGNVVVAHDEVEDDLISGLGLDVVWDELEAALADHDVDGFGGSNASESDSAQDRLGSNHCDDICTRSETVKCFERRVGKCMAADTR